MIWIVFVLKRCAWSKVCPMVTSITSLVLCVNSRLKFVGTMPPVRVMRSARFLVFFTLSFIPVWKARFVTGGWNSAFVGDSGKFLSKFCVCRFAGFSCVCRFVEQAIGPDIKICISWLCGLEIEGMRNWDSKYNGSTCDKGVVA